MSTRWLWKLGILLFIASILLSSTSCILTQTCLMVEYLLTDYVPPEDETNSNLLFTCIQIEDFWNQHGKVPLTPDELTYPEKDNDFMVDGWGNELLWESDGVSTVHVWSLGLHGEPGGSGDETDRGMTFVTGKTEAWMPPVPKEETKNVISYP